MLRARWIISEQGLQSLGCAGLSTGWLRAWLLSAGAESVAFTLLESTDWQAADDEWLLFYATPAELVTVSETLACSEDATGFQMDNAPRRALCYRNKGRVILLLPIGEIAYQRQLILDQLLGNRSLRPLYIHADQEHELPLEAGLSASLIPDNRPVLLNANGLLPEEQLIEALRRSRLCLRTVESCTAGLIAARVCRVPGASDVVDRGWITYTNHAKQQQVAVSEPLIEQFGAVSEPVVRAMAAGGMAGGCACVAVSGIAGPGGGSEEKPVGTVWIAVALAGEVHSECLSLSGSRAEIQAQTVVAVLHRLLAMLDAGNAADSGQSH